MFTALSSTIGSGAPAGTHGPRPGIGDTILTGGTFTTAGHTIGIGITATHGIITITTARSVPDIISTTAIMSCILPYREETTQLFIPIVRSRVVTKA